MNAGDLVTLDASGSYDPNGFELTYIWQAVAGNPLDDPGDTSAPEITAPEMVGGLVFELVVSTDAGLSVADSVTIFVHEDKDHAYFVSPDCAAGNPGTRAEPFASVVQAIAQAAAEGADVYVAGGEYAEDPVLSEGVSIYGGFGPRHWYPGGLQGATVILTGPLGVMGDGAGHLTLDGFTVRCDDQADPGAGSVALRVMRAESVTLSDLRLEAGNGGEGEWAGPCGNADGEGGTGGFYGGYAGLSGEGDTGPLGGDSGAAGSPGIVGEGGLAGGPGGQGAQGSNAQVCGAAFGDLDDMGLYIPAAGGVGGVGYDGGGGGPSIGIVRIDGSATIEDCTYSLGNAGDGGGSGAPEGYGEDDERAEEKLFSGT